jgi:hypothetical protein
MQFAMLLVAGWLLKPKDYLLAAANPIIPLQQ